MSLKPKCNCPNGSYGKKHSVACLTTENERLLSVLKTLLSEISYAEGDYGIGLAMTKAENSIEWSLLDQPTVTNSPSKRT